MREETFSERMRRERREVEIGHEAARGEGRFRLTLRHYRAHPNTIDDALQSAEQLVAFCTNRSALAVSAALEWSGRLERVAAEIKGNT